MLTAPKPDIFSDAVRLKAPPMLTLVPPLPAKAEPPRVSVYEQDVRPTLRIPPEDLEDFESMWDEPVASW